MIKIHLCNLKTVSEWSFSKILKWNVWHVYIFLLNCGLFSHIQGLHQLILNYQKTHWFLMFQNFICFEGLLPKHQRNFLKNWWDYYQIYLIFWNSNLKTLDLNINCFHIFIITRVIFTEHYSSIDRIFFTRLLGVKFISGPTLFSNSCTPKSSFLFSKKLLKRFCRFLIIRENIISVFERYFRSDSTLITDKRFHSCPNYFFVCNMWYF